MRWSTNLISVFVNKSFKIVLILCFFFSFALMNPNCYFQIERIANELLMDTIDVTETFAMAESGVLEAARLRKVPLKDWIFEDRFPD